jgi:hypothetical protein
MSNIHIETRIYTLHFVLLCLLLLQSKQASFQPCERNLHSWSTVVKCVCSLRFVYVLFIDIVNSHLLNLSFLQIYCLQLCSTFVDVIIILNFFAITDKVHLSILLLKVGVVATNHGRVSSTLMIQVCTVLVTIVIASVEGFFYPHIWSYILYFSLLLHSFNTEYLFFCPSI